MLNREYLRRNLVTHPSAREVVEFVANITLLQALTAEEIRHRMEGELHCQKVEEEQDGAVIKGWGGLIGREDARTGTAFCSFDAQALLLGAGPNGAYFIETLARHAAYPTAGEHERIEQLHTLYTLQDYHHTLQFRAWVDQCCARVDEERRRGLPAHIVGMVRDWVRRIFPGRRGEFPSC